MKYASKVNKPFRSFFGIFDHLLSFSTRSGVIFSELLREVSNLTTPNPAVGPILDLIKWFILFINMFIQIFDKKVLNLYFCVDL